MWSELVDHSPAGMPGILRHVFELAAAASQTIDGKSAIADGQTQDDAAVDAVRPFPFFQVTIRPNPDVVIEEVFQSETAAQPVGRAARAVAVGVGIHFFFAEPR